MQLILDKKYNVVMGNRNGGYYYFMREQAKKLYEKCKDKHCLQCKKFCEISEIDNLVIIQTKRKTIHMVHKSCLGGHNASITDERK